MVEIPSPSDAMKTKYFSIFRNYKLLYGAWKDFCRFFWVELLATDNHSSIKLWSRSHTNGMSLSGFPEAKFQVVIRLCN